MHRRKPVTPETLERVASELAGLPISPSLAAQHAQVFEHLMESIETLRSLPLKEIAPPLVFAPEDVSGEQSK